MMVQGISPFLIWAINVAYLVHAATAAIFMVVTSFPFLDTCIVPANRKRFLTEKGRYLFYPFYIFEKKSH